MCWANSCALATTPSSVLVEGIASRGWVTPHMATCLLNMESDQHQSPETEHGEFQWMSIGGYPHNGSQTTSPVMPEYNPYTYGSSAVMPVEPAPFYAMARPPPYSSHQQLQPLHPLIVPPQWPSMLTSQSTYSTPTLSSASTTTPISAGSSNSNPLQIRQTTTGGNTPRRTLTDDDRRRMCQYAEDNPGVKQTDIGCTCATHFSVVSWLTVCSEVRCRAKVILRAQIPMFLADFSVAQFRRFFGKRRSIFSPMMGASHQRRSPKANSRTSNAPSPIGPGMSRGGIP